MGTVRYTDASGQTLTLLQAVLCESPPYLAAFARDDSVVDPGGLIATNFAWYHFNLC